MDTLKADLIVTSNLDDRAHELPTERTGDLHCLAMLVSPFRTLPAIVRAPHFVLPLLYAAIYSAFINFCVIQKIGLENVLAVTMKGSGSVDSANMIANAMSHRTAILGAQAASTMIGTFVTAMIVTLVLWLVAMVAGADVRFRTVAAIEAHVLFLTTFIKQSLLAMTVLLARNPAAVDLRNPVGTNAAFFYKALSPFVQHLLGSADLLTLLAVILVTTGLRAVPRALGVAATAAVVVVPWLVYALAAAFISSMM